jgi:hypothetical protein
MRYRRYSAHRALRGERSKIAWRGRGEGIHLRFVYVDSFESHGHMMDIRVLTLSGAEECLQTIM